MSIIPRLCLVGSAAQPKFISPSGEAGAFSLGPSFAIGCIPWLLSCRELQVCEGHELDINEDVVAIVATQTGYIRDPYETNYWFHAAYVVL